MILTVAFVLLLDLYTKYLAKVHLAPDMERGYPFPRWVEVLPGYFDFRWAQNYGAAFSFMEQYPWVILLISSVMIVGLIIWSFTMRQKQYIVQLSFGLILGGAIGNLIDRVRYGYVIDFLHAYFIHNGVERFWPTFNVADMAIVGGIGLFMYLTAFTKIFDPPKTAEAVEVI